MFATGPSPLSGSQSREEHLRWATDPLHSYVVDGTGALCVWAHPRPSDGPSILALDGLTGIEVLYGHGGKGYPGDRDRMWDQILTANRESGQQFVWGFAADDTHALMTGVVFGLAEDTDGAIWCATGNGVSRYSSPRER